MTISELINREPNTENLQLWIKKVPYAEYLGIEAILQDHELLFSLPPQEKLIGNSMLPAVHGGVVGAFMEQAAIFHLVAKMDKPVLPKMINFSLDYLRPTRAKKTAYAQCQLTRQGQFIANVSILCWQSSPETPCATGRAHFMIPAAERT